MYKQAMVINQYNKVLNLPVSAEMQSTVLSVLQQQLQFLSVVLRWHWTAQLARRKTYAPLCIFHSYSWVAF